MKPIIIKGDTPVMVVIGNPPYSVSSNNKGNWIEKLTADYKKDLNERNIQPLSDDYIKFIRYGQYLVEKNGSGILAYISNNSFIDGIIHRQMRKHLLENFDSIYILDLHGNSKKKEVCQDGSADQNVFDIMQGVSINLFVKTGKKKKNERGQILHSYLFGKREKKYVFLNLNTLKSIEWIKLESNYPNYFFVNKNFEDKAKYEKGFKVDELFIQSNVGLATEFDEFSIKNSRKEAEELLKVLQSTSAPEIISKYKLNPKKVEKVENAIKDIKNNNPIITAIDYRPFDFKYTVYTGVSNGLMGRPRDGIMRHMLKNNLALLTCRQQTSFDFQHVFISNKISERCSVSLQTGEVNYIFPLFLYPENITQQTIGHKTTRFPNLNIEIVKQIAEKIGLTFVPERDSPPPEGCPKGGVVINHIPIKRNFVENLPYNPALKQLAIDKRKAGILSEVLFWQQVYKGRFHQIDFDRQRIIGNYIVDFYVKTLGLVVEIDGDSHDEKTEYDARRQQYLENLGLKVYRIQDGDVKHNLEIVMLELERYIVREYGERTTPAFSHPSEGGEWSPIDILDYIYAVLHSPTYREKYKEFLKIDFPRVPYPKDKDTFWQLVKLGGELRQIHLLECPMVEKRITTYPLAGNNQVEKVWFEIDLSLTLPKGEGTAPPPLEGPGEVQNYSLPIPPPLLEGPGEVSVSDNENNLPGYITANPITYSVIKDYREILKSNPTEAEKVIWEFLRNKKTGYKIRRQHVIDDFITDFVCLPKKVVIEIDGKIHDFHKDYDTLRTLRLNMLGYKVIRFSNEEVLLNPQKVAEKIRVVLDQTSFLALNTSPDLSDCDRDPTPTLPKGEGADSPPLEGRGEVWAVSTEVGKVWINSTQYFVGVPKIAWEFYIGGYQPAQKWLKDRKGRTLGFEDILHYQKIVVALTETDRLMKEIDKIEIE